MIALILSVLGSFAQQNIVWFRTTEFSWKQKNEYGSWTNWSDWEPSNIKVKFDLSKDQVFIYSSSIQIYTIIHEEESPYDDSGTQIKFRVVDQDDDYGHLRLRQENNGNSQIYIDFSNIKWVYNVRRL